MIYAFLAVSVLCVVLLLLYDPSEFLGEKKGVKKGLRNYTLIPHSSSPSFVEIEKNDSIKSNTRCDIISPAKDAAFEAICDCSTWQSENMHCLDSGRRSVHQKFSDIRTKFTVELCQSLLPDEKGVYSGNVTIRKRWSCWDSTVQLQGIRLKLGPDEFMFTLEGNEIIDIGAALQYVVETNRKGYCNDAYRAHIQWRIPGSYSVRFLHTRENFAALDETKIKWPMNNFDRPLGNMIVNLGGDVSDTTQRTNCAADQIGNGRFVWQGQGSPLLFPAKMFGFPYRGPTEKKCFHPLLRVNPLHYKWVPYECSFSAFSRKDAAECLASNKIRFYGDSHFRRMFNILMNYACNLDDAALKKWGTTQCLEGAHGSCRNIDVCMKHDETISTVPKDKDAWIIMNTGQHPADGHHHWSLRKYREHINDLAGSSHSKIVWVNSPSVGGFQKSSWLVSYKDWRTYSRLRAFNMISEDAFRKAGVPVISYFAPTSAMAGKDPDGTHFTAESVMPVIQQILATICESSGSGVEDRLRLFYPFDFNDAYYARLEMSTWTSL